MTKIIRKQNYLLKSTALEHHLDFVERSQYRSVPVVEWDVYPSYYTIYKFTKLEFPIVVQCDGQIHKLGTNQVLIIPPKKLVKWIYPKGLMEWLCYCILSNDINDLPQTCCIFPYDDHFVAESYSALLDIVRTGINSRSILLASKPCSMTTKLSQFLNKNFSYNLSIMDIYQDLRLPSSSANFYFKKAYGLSPLQYRQKMRVFESLKLITHGYKMLEVSKLMGFEDYSCFYKQFVSTLGVSPTDFNFHHENLEA